MDTYKSIIYPNFQQPITTIVYNLVRAKRPSTDWKTNEVDLDWILSGILLTVTMFECALRWTSVHKVVSKNDSWYLYEELRQKHPELPDVREIFVLRNSIAHGHVWDLPTPEGFLARLKARMERGRDNDAHWKACVDRKTQLTRVSGMHVVPSLMTRGDFRLVLEKTTAA